MTPISVRMVDSAYVYGQQPFIVVLSALNTCQLSLYVSVTWLMGQDFFLHLLQNIMH